MAILLPVCVLLYAVLPQKVRRFLLLFTGYFFFCCVSGWLVFYPIFSTVSIYLIGLWLSKIQTKGDERVKASPREQRKALKKRNSRRQKAVVAVGILLNLGILVTLKYSPFFTEIVNGIFKTDFAKPAFAIPIGISFYTLQAIAYLMDVYRRKITADKNIMRFALFMNFFPAIMEGPICRYSETAEALWEAPRIQYRNIVLGTQRILFGLMKKLVVADRLNLLIKNVYSSYQDYDGFVIAVVGICYTVQLYCDFSGTMDLAIGTGQIFGITLPENFRRPFFSRSVSEFWKRWHITLGAWFRDYVFYPVSMSKCVSKMNKAARKRLGAHFGRIPAFAVALFCVWICNGLWHGAGWQYVFFGMYHFVLILAGNIIEPASLAVTNKLHINRDKLPFKLIQIIRTTILVCIGEMFFRAEDLETGFAMFGKIFTSFSFQTLSDGYLFELGADSYDFIIVGVIIVLLFFIGIVNEKNKSIRESAYNINVFASFSVSLALILIIVIFGAYGDGYTPVDPIYASF